MTIKNEPPKPMRTWPNYQLPPSYQLGDPGSGCFLEPPGHPTYFVRLIYTRHGNSPPRPPYCFLNGTGYEKLEDLESLYKPLPLEHPRVQEWIAALFRHMRDCYHNEAASSSDKTLIYPVPDYALKHFHDDERFSEEWRAKEQAAIKQANAEIVQRAAGVAKWDNHNAVMAVRKFYPDFQPTAELIDNPPENKGGWWGRYDERPTPENCPGERWRKHPVNGKWCQVCGWRQESEVSQ